MNKVILVSLSFLVLSNCFAQKSSSESLTIQFTIDPAVQLPQTFLKCKSKVVTPIDPLTKKEEADAAKGQSSPDAKIIAVNGAKTKKFAALEKSYLGIAGRTMVESGEDLSVTLTTTAVTVSHVTEASLADLKMDDEIFRYSVSASLNVKDNTGKVWLDQLVVDPAVEQKITKAAMYLDPTYRVRIALHPKDVSEIFKQFMNDNSPLVLEDITAKAHKAIADAFEIQEKKVVVGLFSVKGKPFAELGTSIDNVQDAMSKFRSFSKKNRIPKEEVDKAFGDAVVVWDKYMTEKKSEMEEKAFKGLSLNCALACAWRNEFDKANTYLANVEEAKSAPVESADGQDSPPSQLGATVMLSFQEYASNLNGLVKALSEYKERVKIVQ